MNKKSLFIVFAILIMAVGFIIRVTLFMSGRALWHDECSLAINILTRNPFQFLSPLEHLQSAPPIFMGLTKILTYIFKTNEYSLRIIPLLASLGSVPLFFLLSTKIFRKKYTQLIAIFLFVINFQLTYYAQEFKQYTLDTFMTILCIYLLSHKELKTMSIRNTILYGIIFALIPLISFPSAFVLIAYIIIQLIKYKLTIIKQAVTITVFPLISAILYSVNAIFSTNSNQNFLKSYFEDGGFLGLNPINWLINIKTNYNYFFYPNKFVLLAILLTIIGLIYIIKNKKNNTQIFLLSTLGVAVIFSILHIYPIFERTSLYLIPIVLFIILTPVDNIKRQEPFKGLLILLITLIYFIGYNPKYIINLFKIDNFKHEHARQAMEDIISEYSGNEIIVYNTASDSEYIFYTTILKFTPHNNIRVNIQTNDQQKYNEVLNQLPKGQTYWFYYPYSLSKYPENSMLKNWSKDKKVNFIKEYNSSLIMQVKM